MGGQASMQEVEPKGVVCTIQTNRACHSAVDKGLKVLTWQAVHVHLCDPLRGGLVQHR